MRAMSQSHRNMILANAYGYRHGFDDGQRRRLGCPIKGHDASKAALHSALYVSAWQAGYENGRHDHDYFSREVPVEIESIQLDDEDIVAELLRIDIPTY